MWVQCLACNTVQEKGSKCLFCGSVLANFCCDCFPGTAIPFKWDWLLCKQTDLGFWLCVCGSLGVKKPRKFSCLSCKHSPLLFEFRGFVPLETEEEVKDLEEITTGLLKDGLVLTREASLEIINSYFHTRFLQKNKAKETTEKEEEKEEEEEKEKEEIKKSSGGWAQCMFCSTIFETVDSCPKCGSHALPVFQNQDIECFPGFENVPKEWHLVRKLKQNFARCMWLCECGGLGLQTPLGAHCQFCMDNKLPKEAQGYVRLSAKQVKKLRKLCQKTNYPFCNCAQRLRKEFRKKTTLFLVANFFSNKPVHPVPPCSKCNSILLEAEEQHLEPERKMKKKHTVLASPLYVFPPGTKTSQDREAFEREAFAARETRFPHPLAGQFSTRERERREEKEKEDLEMALAISASLNFEDKKEIKEDREWSLPLTQKKKFLKETVIRYGTFFCRCGHLNLGSKIWSALSCGTDSQAVYCGKCLAQAPGREWVCQFCNWSHYLPDKNPKRPCPDYYWCENPRCRQWFDRVPISYFGHENMTEKEEQDLQIEVKQMQKQVRDAEKEKKLWSDFKKKMDRSEKSRKQRALEELIRVLRHDWSYERVLYLVEKQGADVHHKLSQGENLFSVLCEAAKEGQKNPCKNEEYQKECVAKRRKIGMYLLMHGVEPRQKGDDGQIYYLWTEGENTINFVFRTFLNRYYELAMWYYDWTQEEKEYKVRKPSDKGDAWISFRDSPYGTLVAAYLCPVLVSDPKKWVYAEILLSSQEK